VRFLRDGRRVSFQMLANPVEKWLAGPQDDCRHQLVDKEGLPPGWDVLVAGRGVANNGLRVGVLWHGVPDHNVRMVTILRRVVPLREPSCTRSLLSSRA
jgi:hypothetical protein